MPNAEFIEYKVIFCPIICSSSLQRLAVCRCISAGLDLISIAIVFNFDHSKYMLSVSQKRKQFEPDGGFWP